MNWTLVRETKTPPTAQVSHITTDDVFRDLLDRGIEKVAKKEWAQPFVGENLVRIEVVEDDAGRRGEIGGYTGLVPINNDGDTLPFLRAYKGFQWEWATFTFRVAAGINRKAFELDRFGLARQMQRDLLSAHRRTVEYVIADFWNRAFGGADGSLLLASDGCYPIDVDRPNPDPDGGTWSNRDATADLTDDTIWEAVLAARQQVGPDGHLAPREVVKIMVGPRREKQMWTILSTERVVGSNFNDKSWSSAVFSMDKVIVYPYLEIDAIFYLLSDPQSEDNEIVEFRRVAPSVLTQWGMPGLNDPDVLGQRLRADWGLAMGCPRRYLRGGLLA